MSWTRRALLAASQSSWLRRQAAGRGFVRRLGPIERVFPGHGPVGGPELLDASEKWLSDYRDVARPGVRFVDVAKEMTRRYPHHGLAILLWLTRGPGFGLAGAKEIGVPPALLGGS